MVTRTLEIGSISSGTMRSVDLLPAFLDALESVDSERYDQFIAEHRITDEWDGENADDYDEAREYAVDALFDVLQEYCPDYCHFGAHEGDGADYGCWISWDTLEEDCRCGAVLKVGEIPADYCGTVLHVNDHGNATLYVCDAGTFTEVWSVV